MPNVTITVLIFQIETPIPGATVTVFGYPSATTNASGVATILNVAPGYHWIDISKTGYITTTIQPNISDQDYLATITLHPLQLNYSDVTITVTGQGTTNPPSGNYPDSYEVNDSLYITATPASGWHYPGKMKRNTVDWTTANPGGFLNLDAVENIEVVFEVGEPPPPDYIWLVAALAAAGAAVAGYLIYKRRKRR